MATGILWAPSRKRALGNVWHVVRFGSVARCDRRQRLLVAEATETPDGYRCVRCTALSASASLPPSSNVRG